MAKRLDRVGGFRRLKVPGDIMAQLSAAESAASASAAEVAVLTPRLAAAEQKAAQVEGLNATIAQMAQAMPSPAQSSPPGVAANSQMGANSGRYARENHTHASSVQRGVVETAADGTATWTFPIAYTEIPTVQVTVETPSGQPYLALITARSMTAVSIKLVRAQPLPSLSGILLIGPLISALAGFNVFGGAVAAGVKVHIWAAKTT